MKTASAPPMPAIFVGHGNPMNVIGHNRWTEAWRRLGAALPRPKAILVISAHWYIEATMTTAMSHPKTIHDFYGFPQELYALQYPASGNPALAARVKDILAPVSVSLDEKWGLDHGAWSVLYHMFPKADVPVVQLSIDRRQPPSFHYEIGNLMAPLRDEGVLLLGSGNLVHNIQAYEWERPDAEAFDWGSSFEGKVRQALLSENHDRMINYRSMGPDAQSAVPTPDHYLPFLYITGSRRKGESVGFPIEGFDGGSMSMLAIQFPAQS